MRAERVVLLERFQGLPEYGMKRQQGLLLQPDSEPGVLQNFVFHILK